MQPGTWNARTTGGAVWEAESGAVMLDIYCEVATGGAVPEKETAVMCLIQKDGTPSQFSLKTLKEIFAWGGVNFEELDGLLPEKDIEVVCDWESFTGKDGSEKQSCRIKWINPVGGSRPMRKEADLKSLTARFGSRLRALGGGTPVAPAAKAAAKAPPTAPPKGPPKGPPKSPPPTAVVVSSLEECWNLLNSRLAGKSDDEIGNEWLQILGGLNADTITPEGWALLKPQFADEIPY